MSEEKLLLLQKVERLQNELNDALCKAASKDMFPDVEIHERQVTSEGIVQQVVVTLNVNLKGF